MLSGDIDVLVAESLEKIKTDTGRSFSLSKNFDAHKLHVIQPSNYNITQAHNYFIKLRNPKEITTSTVVVSVDKNSIRSPISPGITKHFKLAPGESTDYYYKSSKK